MYYFIENLFYLSHSLPDTPLRELPSIEVPQAYQAYRPTHSPEADILFHGSVFAKWNSLTQHKPL